MHAFYHPIYLPVLLFGLLSSAPSWVQASDQISYENPPWTVATYAGKGQTIGSADGARTVARFNYPSDMTRDASGNLYLADMFNFTIRKITPDGVVSTLAGFPGSSGQVDGTGSSARFGLPGKIAIDSQGNLWVSDAPFLRKITSAGVVTSFNSVSDILSLSGTSALAFDGVDNLIFAQGKTVQKRTPGGVISTIAGSSTNGSSDGVGSAASFRDISDLVVDKSGNIFVADSGNSTIRKITPAGVVTTIAGTPTAVPLDIADGTGSAARFNKPISLAIDNAGTLFVADIFSIRKITATGVVTTVAGSSEGGYKEGVGSPTLSRMFYDVCGIVLDDSGNLYAIDTGNHVVRKVTPGGSSASAAAITAQPASQTSTAGGSVTFRVTATGTPVPTYQWYKNGTAIAGATGPALVLSGVTSSSAGSYSVTVSNSGGTATSNVATLTVSATTRSPRLINLSVLTTLSAEQIFTVGFTMQGGSKPVVVRAVGPSLAAFGVAGTMADPRLTLYDGPTSVGSNDNWDGDGSIATAMASVGAFAFANPSSLDAAIVRSVQNGRSVQVAGPSAGAVIVEVYDAGTGDTPRLTNLSAINRVSPIEPLTAGFVLSGEGTKNLLIRAAGPSLGPLGVPGTLADPKLEVYNGGGAKIAENDNYAASLTTTFASVGAFDFIGGAKDAALVVNLASGSYTVVVSGAGGVTGVALVEVYELP